MDDLISRQAAIDELTKHLRMTDVPASYPGIITALTEWLNDLPSAQPFGKDINVSCKDAISRQEAKHELYKMLHDCFWADDEEQDAVAVTLDNLPSAQPEIIHCRKCKFASGDSRICMKFGHSPIGELDFCAWAERRTDGKIIPE